MATYKYTYKNKSGESKTITIEATTRLKADGAFVARTGVFVAERVEEVKQS